LRNLKSGDEYIELFNLYDLHGIQQLGEDGNPISLSVMFQKPPIHEVRSFHGTYYPSYLDQCFTAIKICVPQYRNFSEEALYDIIIETGGYVGENARFVNYCFRLLGQMLYDDE